MKTRFNAEIGKQRIEFFIECDGEPPRLVGSMEEALRVFTALVARNQLPEPRVMAPIPVDEIHVPSIDELQKKAARQLFELKVGEKGVLYLYDAEPPEEFEDDPYLFFKTHSPHAMDAWLCGHSTGYLDGSEAKESFDELLAAFAGGAADVVKTSLGKDNWGDDFPTHAQMVDEDDDETQIDIPSFSDADRVEDDDDPHGTLAGVWAMTADAERKEREIQAEIVHNKRNIATLRERAADESEKLLDNLWSSLSDEEREDEERMDRALERAFYEPDKESMYSPHEVREDELEELDLDEDEEPEVMEVVEQGKPTNPPVDGEYD